MTVCANCKDRIDLWSEGITENGGSASVWVSFADGATCPATFDNHEPIELGAQQ